MSYQAIQESLGGEEVLHRSINSDADLFAITSEGLPKKSVEVLSKIIGMSLHTLTEKYLDISYRGLQRKLDSDILSTKLTEQLLRIAGLYSRGNEVFDGSSEDFKLWLSTPCRPLGDQKPQDLLVNGFGIDMVQDQLERMEYGIY